MIFCNQNQLENQIPNNELLQQAIAWLKSALDNDGEIAQKLQQLQPGSSERVDIAGTDLYASLICYETIPNAPAKLEAHNTYIDIQCVWQGEEQIAVAERSTLTLHTPYNDEKDFAFYNPANMVFLPMVKGNVVVLFPNDAHGAQVAVAQPVCVRKIVVKVKYA